ncbi:glycosyltransferase family 39 protein [Patescibacteria group bacterium]|nr:glycosyltransferase family 39 protein [Patescibacteria group bacterium]
MNRAVRTWILLTGIVAIGFFLRVWHVDTNPPSLSWDEVSIGYNAYSILKTGKDEHGRFLPVDTFIAYGDYKPPLAIYATVPFVAFLGLTELAVRLPSAVAGTLTILALFALGRELFGRKSNIPLPAALVFALSPWSIQLSRAGFEANIATGLMVLGAYLVLLARRHPQVLLACWIPFVMGVYTFNSARYFGPFLALGLFVSVRRDIMGHKKFLASGVLIGILLLLPIIPHLLSRQARLRFNEVNIFTDASIVATANMRSAVDGNTWWAKLVHNRRIGYTRSFLEHFFDNLEPRFLFITGDGNPKFSIQDIGELYLVDLPFLLLGVYWIMGRTPGAGWFLLWWLVMAIVPAATARETPHALRIEDGLPVFLLVIAAGLSRFLEGMRKARFGSILVALVLFLYLGNIAYYLHNYYIHYPWEYSGEWQYGYKQALADANKTGNTYSSIVLTESIGRAYMYTLFYERYNPMAFLVSKHAYFDAAGFYHVTAFGKYHFVEATPSSFEPHTLYILPPEEVPEGAHVINTVRLLDGKPALVLFDV